MIIETGDGTFSRNLRYLRLKNRLSLRALAKHLDISVYSLKKLEESSSGAVFTDQTLRRLCEVFRVPMEDILHRELSFPA